MTAAIAALIVPLYGAPFSWEEAPPAASPPLPRVTSLLSLECPVLLSRSSLLLVRPLASILHVDLSLTLVVHPLSTGSVRAVVRNAIVLIVPTESRGGRTFVPLITEGTLLVLSIDISVLFILRSRNVLLALKSLPISNEWVVVCNVPRLPGAQVSRVRRIWPFTRFKMELGTLAGPRATNYMSMFPE